MRWNWAFGISGLLLIARPLSLWAYAGLTGAGFHRWHGGEITLEKPAEMDVMRGATKAGYEEPRLQNFGSSHDIMVRMPPTEGEPAVRCLVAEVVTIINEATNQTRP